MQAALAGEITMKRYSISLALMLTLALSACATNPVTGKKELSLISEQQELAMGAQQYAPLRQSQGGDYNVDPALTSYVSEIGQRLAKVSDRQLPYEFKVLNNGVPNAWALPGGKIVVNRGLLTELHNEAELAAVLGHEITHAAARHTAHNMSRGMVLQGAVIGATIAAAKRLWPCCATGGEYRGANAQSALQPRCGARVGLLRYAVYVACRIRSAGSGWLAGNVRQTRRRATTGLVTGLVRQPSTIAGAGAEQSSALAGVTSRRRSWSAALQHQNGTLAPNQSGL